MHTRLWKYGDPKQVKEYDPEDGCVWCQAGRDCSEGTIFLTDGIRYAEVMVFDLGGMRLVQCDLVSVEYIEAELKDVEVCTTSNT